MLHKLPSWAPFLIAFFTCLGLTSALIRVCTQKGWLVFPREERWSRRAVARFGGVAIVLSLLAGSCTLRLNHQMRVIVLLTAAMAVLGLLDDIFELPARWKLAGQVGLAVLAVWNGIGYPLFQHFWPNFLFAVFFLVAITNAFNLLDNMDGLAAGVGIIAAFSLWLMAPQPGTFPTLLLVMIGSLLGFLLFNFNPAKIFMGDTGSLAIGFFLASSTIVTAGHITTVFSVLSVPGLVLFLPLFDMLLVSITRRFNGRAISAGARDHTSHRLVMLGMSERRAVLTLYFISAFSGTLALACKSLLQEVGAGILALFLLFATLLWFYLAKVQLPNGWLSRTNVFTLALPETLNSLARRSAVVFTDIFLLIVSQYIGFLLRFDNIPPQYVSSFLWGCALAIAVKLPLFSLFGVYRRDSRIRTLRDVYPIVKGNILGSLIIVTVLTYIAGFHNFSRAVMGVDVLFATCLMIVARAAGRFFDDVLTTFPTQSYVVVGEASAEFYYRYFEWQKLHANIIAFVSSDKTEVGMLYGIPVIGASELPALLGTKRVDAMYLLPDCRDATAEFAVHLAGQHCIPVHVLRLTVDTLDKVIASPRAAYAAAGSSAAAPVTATVGRKLKIARIIGRLNVGGPARQACFLHQALRARYDTVLITGRIDEGEGDMSYLLSSQEGVRWVPSMSRPVKLWSDLLALWHVFHILRQERPDIVHTHTAKAGALGRAAAVLAGVPVRLHSYHGHVFRGYFGAARVWLWLAIERFLAHFTTRIVAISPSLVKELAQQYYIAPAEKIAVIRNGFDLQRLGDARPRGRVRREFGIGDSDFLVLWVGRMVTVKNVALLGHTVRAAAKLPRIRFLVVGDGPDRAALHELTADFGNVHYTGWRTEVAELWAAADAALLTSLNEGTPTALIEAMAAAKPFVATDAGGVVDLVVPPLVESGIPAVKQAANGFLSIPDPTAMVQALQRLHDDPALARTMGQAGREFVCSLHTEERLLRDMTALYEEVADSRTRQKVIAAAPHAAA